MNDEIFIKREVKTSKDTMEIFSLFYHVPFSILLDSSLNTHELGKNSIIVFDPFLVFRSKGNNISIERNMQVEEHVGNPFEYLRDLLNENKTQYVSELPFLGGGVGYFSYDLCHHIETIKQPPNDDKDIPEIVLGFYNNAIIVDHRCRKTYAVASSVGFEEVEGIEVFLEEKINHIINRVCERTASSKGSTTIKVISNDQRAITSNITLEEYCSMILKAKEYIRNGDIYQANLSQRFTANVGESNPFDIYRDLRESNAAPFSAYMNLGDIKVLCSSPERFFKTLDRVIETRPIKGTRPRGANIQQDKILCEELINSEKDRAEHIMIVDLERNDLGRVCKIGSVHVKEMLKVEEYATVFHLVSTIKGELLDNVDIIDCIKAMFPGGSITGAPKIRAMEIIAQLEHEKRNIYTGAIGYIGFNGNCDLNIAIRTIVIKDSEAFFNVGGGIVWDSVPEDEYQETLDKGKALIKVLTERR